MQKLSSNLKRDIAFVGLGIFVVLGIWSPAWAAPLWLTLAFYAVGFVFLIPAVRNGRETGFDPLSNAVVAVLSVAAMMVGAISYFVWEMFFRF